MGRKYSLRSVVYFSAFCVITAQVILYVGYLYFWSKSEWRFLLKSGCGNGKIEENEYYIGSLKKQVSWLLAANRATQHYDATHGQFFLPDLPIIYAITPTYNRPTQMPELVRLSQTLINVPNFHWILVEDAENISANISSFLRQSGITYTHLFAQTPNKYKLNENDPNWLKPRGVFQRNRGIKWIIETFKTGPTTSIVYFADDDNTYSLELFEEMRRIHHVGVWPVGLSGGLLVETPLVQNGKVVGWNAIWKSYRTFPIDMAGFAVKMQLILDHPNISFNQNSKRGLLETTFLTELNVQEMNLEPMAKNCTKVLVWHTRTEKAKLKDKKQKQEQKIRNEI